MTPLLTFAAITIAMLSALMVLIHEAPVVTDGTPAHADPSYINGIGCSLAVACALFLGAQVL